MTHSAQQILDAALGLNGADRAALAARLLESLDEDDDAGVEEAWQAEIARRLKELEDETVQTIPWREARAMIHQPKPE